MTKLEQYFEKFRKDIIGVDKYFTTPYGRQKMIYADWIASGRFYEPIENKLSNLFGEMLGNTHSEASETGVCMTYSYHLAKDIIKNHVNADKDDIIITEGSGMTGVINKLQRILGLKISERTKEFCPKIEIPKENKPIIFITHMEHHSNQTSWLETIADVVVLEPNKDMLVEPNNLREELKKYKNRKLKIGSFSACSNVTGITTPYYELAEIMHENDGFCFIDFAASAPYLEMNMHPENPKQKLDAIFFSPHKFLGGPGSSGVLIFNKNLYKNEVPDHPGGGTVTWTNRWGEHAYSDDIEAREDGGTPAFMQTIRTALCLKLKEKMGVENIFNREEELKEIAFKGLNKINGLHILCNQHKNRIGAFSFYVDNIHHNLIVKLLNDRFGIQLRGGCSCAGTYGHYLFDVDIKHSKSITEKINQGDLSNKPGWVRLSVHPTMIDIELNYIINAINQVVTNINLWQKDYDYCCKAGEFYHKKEPNRKNILNNWFRL